MKDDPNYFDEYGMDFRGEQPNREPRVPQGISNTRIPNFNPSYTDDYFRKARLIWGSNDVPFWNYSDRIRSWFGEATSKAWDQAKADGFVPQSSAHVQRYLAILHEDNDLELIGIQAGHNLSNGYPYQVFGYKYKSATDAEKE